MKKFCCLILMFMLCMSTTYAAKGKECLNYLYGCWAILNSNLYYYFDDKGFIEPLDPKPNKPKVAYRYKYKKVYDFSHLNSAGKGSVDIEYTDKTRSYFFDNFKQFRHSRAIRGQMLTCLKISNQVQGNIPADMKIIDYDTIAEPAFPIVTTAKQNTYLYTPEKGANQLKIVTSSNNENDLNVNIYDKEGTLIYNHTFSAPRYLWMRKIFLRPGKSDLIIYDAGSNKPSRELAIIGKNNTGITNIFDIKNKKMQFESDYGIKVEYDGIYLIKYNRDGSVNFAAKQWIITPSQSGQEYTQKLVTRT